MASEPTKWVQLVIKSANLTIVRPPHHTVYFMNLTQYVHHQLQLTTDRWVKNEKLSLVLSGD